MAPSGGAVAGRGLVPPEATSLRHVRPLADAQVRGAVMIAAPADLASLVTWTVPADQRLDRLGTGIERSEGHSWRGFGPVP